MLPTHAVIAGLCLGIYRYTDCPPVAFDVFDDGADDGVCWALKKLPDVDVVVLRGSTTPHDWTDDFTALPIPTRVGMVHAGFHDGLEHMWADVRPHLTQPVIVTGHSLGAARASILTALMIKDGVPPRSRVVFGEPRPGLASHADIVGRCPGWSYCNGYGGHHDLVTDVPFPLPGCEFTRASPLIPLSEPPAPGDPWGIFAFHHMQLYAAALCGTPKETAA